MRCKKHCKGGHQIFKMTSIKLCPNQILFSRPQKFHKLSVHKKVFTNLTSAAYIYFKKKIGINDEVTARNVDVAKEIFRSDASIANEIPVSDSMREDMLIVVELFAARL